MTNTIKKRTSAMAVVAATFSACLLVAANVAGASDWKPTRTVDIVVPGGPGGGFDTTARIIQRIASEEGLLDVPVRVLNRPGGGGNVGLSYLQQQPNDGHTQMITAASFLVNHIMGRSEHTFTHQTPLATLYHMYIGIIVPSDAPYNTPEKFLDTLRDDHRALTFGFCCSRGGGNHLAAAQIISELGEDPKTMRTVVYGNTGELTSAVLGGHVDVASYGPSNAISQIREGSMKVLGIAAPERLSGELSDVPTWREMGINSVSGLWRTMIGPEDMPAEQVAFWEDFYEKLVATDAWKAELERGMWEGTFYKSDETHAYLTEQYEALKAILTDLEMVEQ